MTVDKRAKKILFDTYWKGGWIRAADRVTSAEDFAYAKSKGVMFDPITIDHDECLAELHALSNQISVAEVSAAFVSSLSTRRLEVRSAVSSFVLAGNIAAHHYQDADRICATCRDSLGGIVNRKLNEDADLNVLNFERFKWGGVRRGQLLYMYFDLREFSRIEVPEPTSADIACLTSVLAAIEESKPDDFPGALADRLADCIKSNKNERASMVETLASIGVLQPQSFDRPTRGKHDWTFATYWRGEDGYNQEAVDMLFGRYLN